jgi:hypothetical protein
MSDENEDILDELLKALEIKGTKVTIVYEHIHLPGGTDSDGGGGSFGGSLVIGDLVGGGGVVTDVTGSSVTINFPNGVPRGPIVLPGVDTTIVVKESAPPEEESVDIAPFWTDDQLSLSSGAAAEPVEVVEVEGGLSKRFTLPCPGSVSGGNYVRLPDEFFPLILNPTNTGDCSCMVFLISIDANGKKIGPHIMLRPGESVPVFQAATGAVAILAACSGGCVQPGCQSRLTISLPVS